MQLDLLSYTPPHIAESQTSRAAAENIKEETPALRQLVLSAFKRAGFSGLTDAELFAEMVEHCNFHGKESTIRARRIELTKDKWAKKVGLDTAPLANSGGTRREEVSRSFSTVWVLKEFAA